MLQSEAEADSSTTLRCGVQGPEKRIGGQLTVDGKPNLSLAVLGYGEAQLCASLKRSLAGGAPMDPCQVIAGSQGGFLAGRMGRP
ncbi:uncharacterized protein N7515_008522 [Penicillium bovifimosum]|uniref:Uncharacterized protein n=1 Tax=Penicillium bovifimosum TaxID=126998 RepID=A0A9W9GPF2_9EURO|nr:uncharacterized protein N7515_008522 [Penicillium bovifimosum]KAJ5124697.1 hypothetical protein N7515_008522 [Penicillium bovifimosum]